MKSDCEDIIYMICNVISFLVYGVLGMERWGKVGVKGTFRKMSTPPVRPPARESAFSGGRADGRVRNLSKTRFSPTLPHFCLIQPFTQ
jgi:hypothetical protein